jgi:D-aminopeptidase
MTGKNWRIAFVLILLPAGLFHPDGFAHSPRKNDDSPAEKRQRADQVGLMRSGPLNAITDVAGVSVGHKTLIQADSIRTGVTAILPHQGNIFQDKVPAAIFCFNAFGKLAGSTQVEELGNIETPIILTNTLSVGTALAATVKFTLSQEGNENVRSVNAVVGETNDGFLNDIRGQHVREADVIDAIQTAGTGLPAEGSVGAGTGTSAFGYKGGIGTASRITPRLAGKSYTVGVLVQSNFGWELTITGVPFTRESEQKKLEKSKYSEDGSCMIIIATDAPLSVENLKRLAKRSFTGMARTRAFMSNGSGDYAIAFSTAYHIPYHTDGRAIDMPGLIANDDMNTLFRAVEEATQEAIYNSLLMATTITGYRGHTRSAVSIDEVVTLLKRYNMLYLRKRLNWSPYIYE